MYLGLDFGTSSVKGVLIDAKQKIVATASAALKVSRPHPGWSEQNPDDWWKACNTVVKTLGKMKPKAIAAVEGIGLSGQQHGATLLGKDGKPLKTRSGDLPQLADLLDERVAVGDGDGAVWAGEGLLRRGAQRGRRRDGAGDDQRAETASGAQPAAHPIQRCAGTGRPHGVRRR